MCGKHIFLVKNPGGVLDDIMKQTGRKMKRIMIYIIKLNKNSSYRYGDNEVIVKLNIFRHIVKGRNVNIRNILSVH